MCAILDSPLNALYCALPLIAAQTYDHPREYAGGCSFEWGRECVSAVHPISGEDERLFQSARKSSERTILCAGVSGLSPGSTAGPCVALLKSSISQDAVRSDSLLFE